MTIESQLKDLTDAINGLTAAIVADKTTTTVDVEIQPVKVEKEAPKKASKAKTKPEQTDIEDAVKEAAAEVEKPTKPTKKLNYDKDVLPVAKDILKLKGDKGGRKGLETILDQFGVAKASELEEDQYVAFIDEAKKVVG